MKTLVPPRLMLLGLLAALMLAGCGSNSTNSSTKTKTLTVLAASSLTGTFTQLASEFETRTPGVKVKLVFDSSATLAQQTIQGAPGDVLATADKKTMDQAKSAGGVSGDPKQFATNVIELAVPKANPAGITKLDDLNKKGVKFLTCVPTAPCGSAADALLSQDGVTAKPASEEVDVKSVLAKVTAGEADAGLVYRTDVTASEGKVTGIDVPGADASPNTYWIAITANASGGGDLAAEWIDFLTGTEGKSVLESAGFGTVD